MQAAQNISQVFMGVNLKCASCHDSFINDYTLADSYGLASIYSNEPLEMYRCDKPTGKKAAMKFLYPELGEIDSSMDRSTRLKKLAAIVTSEQNGRLTRTIVNRLWARFMGHGLVEPVDEMDNPAWNQPLLDWLASDLVEHDYDLKRTITLILTSKAYQLPSIAVSELQGKDFVFHGPLIRRMTAEQFLDGLSEITDIWERDNSARINFAQLAGENLDSNFKDASVQPKWIWKDSRAAQKTDPVTIYLRKFFEIPSAATDAELVITCDNRFTLFVNGVEVGEGKDFGRPTIIDLRGKIRPGINLIAIAANNSPGDPKNPDADQRNAAGLWAYAKIRCNAPDGKETIFDFGSDDTWLWALDPAEGWEKPAFAAANWNRAVELGNADAAPWKIGNKLAYTVANLEFSRKIRAALANNDPLMTALGRPNREQVVTTRSSAATTLQALELTNGDTLARELKKAGKLFAKRHLDPDDLVTDIYERAFGRKPSNNELNVSKEILGNNVQSEGVEDLLWATTMLPEFQLIY
jgi:hypothetical protein